MNKIQKKKSKNKYAKDDAKKIGRRIKKKSKKVDERKRRIIKS
jgi:hypothetical protein